MRSLKYEVCSLAVVLLASTCTEPKIPDTKDCVSEWCNGTRSTESLVLQRPVALCNAAAAQLTGSFKVGILIDSSGSMGGFSRDTVIQPTYSWIRRGVQQLGAPPQRNVSVTGAWTFNESVGVKRLNDTITDYDVAHVNTNIDAAIRQSDTQDAIVIITDGIPYVGAGSASDCAGTADPSCVAKTVLNFLNNHNDSGMWVVPLLTEYQGHLDTEGQPVPLDDNYTSQISRALGSEFRRDANTEIELRVERPQNGRPAYLVWKGPKILLAIVLAKNQQFGRLLVWSLMARAADAGFPIVGNAGSWEDAMTRRSGASVGVLTPIEVYPGIVPAVSRITAAPVPFAASRSEQCAGVMTLRSPLVQPPSGNATSVEFTCGPDYGLRVFALQLHTSDEPQCIHLYVLPALHITIVEEPGDYARDKSTCIAKKGDEDVLAAIRLDLTCPGDQRASASTVRVTGETSFAGIDETLRQATHESAGAAGYVKRLTTKSLPQEPFAVLGLDSLLEQIVRGVRQDVKAAELVSLSIQRKATTK